MDPLPVLIPAAERRIVKAFGEEVHFHLEGEHTGGRLAQWLEITPPGGGPPPHYHTLEDEWFYVVEGRVSFLRDGAWQELPAGSGAFMPKNSVHAFKNIGDAPSKMIVTTAPAGFEKFFARAAEEFAAPGGADFARIAQIACEHGIHFV